MKKLFILGLLVAAVVAVGFAAKKPPTPNPTWVTAKTSTESEAWLVVAFKHTGLNPANLQVTCSLSADAQSTYNCVSIKSPKLVQTGKIPLTTGWVNPNSTEIMSIPTGGNLVDSMALAYPEATTVLTCGSGFTCELTKVEYTNVVLTDGSSDAPPSGSRVPVAGDAAWCTESLFPSN
jgi:hypothetical protein